MRQSKERNTEYSEKIQDWIVEKFCDEEDKNPNHSQFSAAQVVDIIRSYERAKLRGDFSKAMD